MSFMYNFHAYLHNENIGVVLVSLPKMCLLVYILFWQTRELVGLNASARSCFSSYFQKEF